MPPGVLRIAVVIFLLFAAKRALEPVNSSLNALDDLHCNQCQMRQLHKVGCLAAHLPNPDATRCALRWMSNHHHGSWGVTHRHTCGHPAAAELHPRQAPAQPAGAPRPPAAASRNRPGSGPVSKRTMRWFRNVRSEGHVLMQQCLIVAWEVVLHMTTKNR